MARAEYSEILKACGMIGGVTVYHDSPGAAPGHGDHRDPRKASHHDGSENRGEHEGRFPRSDLYIHINRQKNWQDYYRFAPHFHLVGFGALPGLEEFEERFPGWRYHNKGTVPNVGGLLRYLFTHQALMPGRYAVTWSGRLASAALGKERLRTTEREVICEKTGLPWVIVESAIPAEIGRTYTEPVTEYRSFFRAGMKRTRADRAAWSFPKSGKRSMAPHEVHEKEIPGDGEVLR